MNNLSRNLGFLVLLAGFVSVASAGQVQGILIDKACSLKAANGGQSVATAHDRECALMPSCQQSGYGVFTADNKFLAFDAGGNTQAIAALKNSKKKNDLQVTVIGAIQGDTIQVVSLKLI